MLNFGIVLLSAFDSLLKSVSEIFLCENKSIIENFLLNNLTNSSFVNSFAVSDEFRIDLFLLAVEIIRIPSSFKNS